MSQLPPDSPDDPRDQIDDYEAPSVVDIPEPSFEWEDDLLLTSDPDIEYLGGDDDIEGPTDPFVLRDELRNVDVEVDDAVAEVMAEGDMQGDGLYLGAVPIRTPEGMKNPAGKVAGEVFVADADGRGSAIMAPPGVDAEEWEPDRPRLNFEMIDDSERAHVEDWSDEYKHLVLETMYQMDRSANPVNIVANSIASSGREWIEVEKLLNVRTKWHKLKKQERALLGTVSPETFAAEELDVQDIDRVLSGEELIEVPGEDGEIILMTPQDYYWHKRGEVDKVACIEQIKVAAPEETKVIIKATDRDDKSLIFGLSKDAIYSALGAGDMIMAVGSYAWFIPKAVRARADFDVYIKVFLAKAAEFAIGAYDLAALLGTIGTLGAGAGSLLGGLLLDNAIKSNSLAADLMNDHTERLISQAREFGWSEEELIERLGKVLAERDEALLERDAAKKERKVMDALPDKVKGVTGNLSYVDKVAKYLPLEIDMQVEVGILKESEANALREELGRKKRKDVYDKLRANYFKHLFLEVLLEVNAISPEDEWNVRNGAPLLAVGILKEIAATKMVELPPEWFPMDPGKYAQVENHFEDVKAGLKAEIAEAVSEGKISVARSRELYGMLNQGKSVVEVRAALRQRSLPERFESAIRDGLMTGFEQAAYNSLRNVQERAEFLDEIEAKAEFNRFKMLAAFRGNAEEAAWQMTDDQKRRFAVALEYENQLEYKRLLDYVNNEGEYAEFAQHVESLFRSERINGYQKDRLLAEPNLNVANALIQGWTRV